MDKELNSTATEPTPSEAASEFSAEAFRPTVARIETQNGDINKDGTIETTGGTGFFVTSDGVLATDYHVVKDADQINVFTADGIKRDAAVRAIDRGNDLALLDVEKQDENETFKAAPLAESSDVPADTALYTLGHPRRSETAQLSEGNGTGRAELDDFMLAGGFLPGEQPDRDVLVSKVPVNVGNSGGFLARTDDGQVIGIIGLQKDKQTSISTPVEELHELMDRSGLTPENETLAQSPVPVPSEGSRLYYQATPADSNYYQQRDRRRNAPATT